MNTRDNRPTEGGELLTAEAVAQYLELRPTTIYEWCRDGRLPALKLGKEWRIRRSALNAFLEQSERRSTLTAQLQAFIRVPDDLLGIAEDISYLHRLDAAFFQVGEAHDAMLVKFMGIELESLDVLRDALETSGLDVRRLEREGRMLLIQESDPRTARAARLRELMQTEAAQGRLVFVSFNWTEQVDLETVMQQQKAIAAVVSTQRLVVKTALLQKITDEWLAADQQRAWNLHTGVIWLNERGVGMRRMTPIAPLEVR